MVVEYATTAAGIAFGHFWTNDVRGDLQGEYDRVWGDVARAFRGNPWVLGYDPFNEPFSTSLIRFGDEHFDAQLECFYTGTAHVGAPSHGAPALRCPRHDPANGVVPTILANDPSHLIFDEPDNYASRGFPTYLGPMNLPDLVFNVHIYCGARSPVTGNPTNVAACASRTRARWAGEPRTAPMASSLQPGGPAWLVTEFGATSSAALLSEHHRRTWTRAGRVGLLGLEVLRRPHRERFRVARDGRRPSPLDRPRAEPHLPAGGRRRADLVSTSRRRPVCSTSTYVPDHRIHAPTVIFVPTEIHYPHGYCARASGRGYVAPGSDLLKVQKRPIRAPGEGGRHPAAQDCRHVGTGTRWNAAGTYPRCVGSSRRPRRRRSRRRRASTSARSAASSRPRRRPKRRSSGPWRWSPTRRWSSWARSRRAARPRRPSHRRGGSPQGPHTVNIP